MFLFAAPSIILIVLAVAPAVGLVLYIYRLDKLEQEPPRLILRLVVMGIVSTFLAVITERIGMTAIDLSVGADTLLGRILLYFVVVGLSEEGFKYLVLKFTTWRNQEFNCKFDGVVYAVSVSLGFALWENIQYVLAYGFSTALLRAVTAIPGHACFGVIMGGWYGLAKRKEQQNWPSASRLARFLAC